MKKIAVIYKSAYGTTKRYAEWIAEELNASLFEASGVKPAQLKEYDVIIYGGGLYAGGILGVKFVTKNPCKSLTIFTVGLADPETTDYSEILKKNFTPDFLSAAKVFHLRGGIDYKELGLIHKAMMAFMKKMVSNQTEAEITEEDKYFLETYGGKVYFTDRETINPLVDYVRTL